MKETMAEYIDEQCINIDKKIITCSSKKAYNTLKSLTKTSQTKVSVVADAEDNMTAIATALNRLTNNCRERPL